LPSTAITRYPPARQEAQPRLWRGQEGQRPQAARRRRHDRATAVRADHRRRRPGPRRGETAAVEPGTCGKPSPRSGSPGPTADTPASSSPGPRASSSHCGGYGRM